MLPLKYTYIDGIDIELTDDDVQSIAQGGQNDSAVAFVCTKEYVLNQFKNYTRVQILNAANSYGCELKANTSRLKAIEYVVWLAAWNISEGDCFDVEVA